MIDGDISFPRMLLEQYSISETVLFPKLNTPLMLEDIFELFKSDNANISRKFEILLCSTIISLAHFSKNTVSDYTSINKAKRFIDKKIDSKLNLDEVAEYANVSVSFLCREFKKAFGVTPYNYILNAKVELAKTMLLETAEPVHLICERFNFADIAHFSKAFKKYIVSHVTQKRTRLREAFVGVSESEIERRAMLLRIKKDLRKVISVDLFYAIGICLIKRSRHRTLS